MAKISTLVYSNVRQNTNTRGGHNAYWLLANGIVMGRRETKALISNCHHNAIPNYLYAFVPYSLRNLSSVAFLNFREKNGTDGEQTFNLERDVTGFAKTFYSSTISRGQIF